MSDRALRIYHKLPYPARMAVAGFRGLYLRRWRYGSETPELIRTALEAEQWPEQTWALWQQNRMAAMLHHAATRVPYYRALWEERRRKGDRSTWEDLRNWPLLDKDTVRSNPLAFIADGYDRAGMFHEHTSGTSGKPLDIWWTRELVRTWYALFEARCRMWNGVTRFERWGILGGQLVAPVEQTKPPFWVWNCASNQLYMSSYHLAPDLIPHYLHAMERHGLRSLVAYPSAVHALAQGALRRGTSLSLKVIVTTAEPLLEHQRRDIVRAFGCPVRETYGMTEGLAASSECEHGRLHLWPELGWLETVDDDGSPVRGLPGRLIATTLLNKGMPLIRYCVGDRGTLPAVMRACPCGRSLPYLSAVEGRVDDVLMTPDGRHIGRLDPVFKSQAPIREAQIIQTALDTFVVRYVAEPGFSPAHGTELKERLRARLGNVVVQLEPVASIARGANGKFKAVVCAIPPDRRPSGRTLAASHF